MEDKKLIIGVAFAVAVALVVFVATQSGTTVKAADKSAPATVKIDNFIFGPQSLTVVAGTTVTWTNNDDVPHNVVSDDKQFKSRALDTGEQFSYTFTKAGTYSYFCSVHPKMNGQVVVK